MAETQELTSCIYGNGWGHAHRWKQTFVAQVGSHTALKRATYVCQACGASFNHHYDVQPNIFTAINEAGVLDQCTT